MKTIQAVGGRVIVIPLTGETDEDGRPMSGDLYLGREERYPIGLVVSVGDDVPDGVNVGDRVLWARDLGAEFKFEGATFNSLHTMTECPRCHSRIRGDEIMAVLPREEAESVKNQTPTTDDRGTA